MGNARTIISVMVCVMLLGGLAEVSATTIFDDGQIHDIDWWISGDVEVRGDAFFGGTTIVNLLPGGSIRTYLEVYDDSQVTISGGSAWRMHAFGSSQVTISGGSVNSLDAHDSSQVIINGGSMSYVAAFDNGQVSIYSGLIAYVAAHNNNQEVAIHGGSVDSGVTAADNGHIAISGGSIGGEIYVGRTDTGSIDSSTITFIGSNFAINGTSVGYGEYDTMGQDSIHGTLTGTLANGDPLDNGFYIYDDSTIVLAPGPFVSDPYCTGPIIGDLNDDCHVDLADLAMMVENWMTCNLEPQSACWE